MLPMIKPIRLKSAAFAALGALAVLPQAQAAEIEVLHGQGQGKVAPDAIHLDHPPRDPKEALLVKELLRPIPPAINAAFDTNLYKILKADQGNVLFSPYSISDCMGMVYAGSGGNTAAEIGKAMSFVHNANSTAMQLLMMRKHFTRSLNQGEDKLRVANALCVTGMVPQQAYQDLVRQQFQGELFAGGLDEINGWVKKKTEGKVEKILDRLDANSTCVLLNAVYFKGSWKTPFPAHGTHKAAFWTADGKEVRVDMMVNDGNYKLLREDDLIAVEMPYKHSASMVLIMPDKPDGMKAVEDKLNPVMLDQLCGKLLASQVQKIDLHVPKFKIASEYDLMGPMKQLGIKDAFDFDKADFQAMYGKSEIAISQIKHKATLEVGEEGTVASAATAVEMMENKMKFGSEAPKIRFNRPFLVLIREHGTGTHLFVGRISDPTQ